MRSCVMNNPAPSRRKFLKGALAAAGVTYISSRTGFARQAQRASPASPHEKLAQFRYREVKLTGGPLKDQFDRVHKAYLTLNEDQLLKVFRQRAHLPAPGEDMAAGTMPRLLLRATASASTSRGYLATMTPRAMKQPGPR